MNQPHTDIAAYTKPMQFRHVIDGTPFRFVPDDARPLAIARFVWRKTSARRYVANDTGPYDSVKRIRSVTTLVFLTDTAEPRPRTFNDVNIGATFAFVNDVIVGYAGPFTKTSKHRYLIPRHERHRWGACLYNPTLNVSSIHVRVRENAGSGS